MAIIIFIRHGDNDFVTSGRLAGRLPGVHLNDNGRKQAQTLAKRLEQTSIKAVYSSPLERTVETAQPIADSFGLEVIKRPGLIEIDVGTWQDKTLKQLRQRKLWQAIQNNPSRAQFPEGESFIKAQTRITDELEVIAREHKPEDLVVCVSHSDNIKLAVAHYLGMHLDLFQRIIIDPASITTLMIQEHSARVINMNLPVFSIIPQHPRKQKRKH